MSEQEDEYFQYLRFLYQLCYNSFIQYMLNNSSLLRLPPSNASLNFMLAQKMRQTQRINDQPSHSTGRQRYTHQNANKKDRSQDALSAYLNDYSPTKSFDCDEVKQTISTSYRRQQQEVPFYDYQSINRETERKRNIIRLIRKKSEKKEKQNFQKLFSNVSNALSEINYEINKNSSYIEEINRLNEQVRPNRGQIMKRVNFKYAPILSEKEKVPFRKPKIIYSRNESEYRNPIRWRPYRQNN